MHTTLLLVIGFLATVIAAPVEIVFDLPPGARLESPITSCGNEDDILQLVKEISVNPNPPVKGENMTVSGSGVTTQTIEQGAYADVVVHYGLIKLLTQKFDLCEQAKEVDLECPIAPGKYDLTKTVALPGQIPPGTYKVDINVKQPDNSQITCLKAQVKFGF